MKSIESEIFNILLNRKSLPTTAKAIYKKLSKYFKKCINGDCKFCRENVCIHKKGYTVSCSESKPKFKEAK
jgi:hypothetical protein